MMFSLLFSKKVESKKAKEDLAAVRDRKMQQIIIKAIKKLETSPQERGKALEHDFAGYRRLRTAQNYRVIYRVKLQFHKIQHRCFKPLDFVFGNL